MNNPSFSELLKDINCRTVVFFEDDFVLQDDDKELFVYNYLNFFSDADKEILPDYCQSEIDRSIMSSLKEIQDLRPPVINDYFELKAHIKENAAIQKLVNQMNLSKSNIGTFFSFGLFVPLTLSNDYKSIFDAIRTIPKMSIRIFRTYDEYENFKNLVPVTPNKTNSEYVLFIIDQNLTNSNVDGVKIKEILDEDFQENGLSFIYTSKQKPDEDNGIAGKQDSCPDKFYNYTVECFYKSIFAKLKAVNLNSAQAAYNTASKNYRNIKHIIKKAKDEGLSSFDAINNWYEHARNFYSGQEFSDSKMNRFAEILDRHQLSLASAILPEEECIEKINSHEVFDYSINNRYFQPSSGDIFFSENDRKYYVLLGQTCDLTLRANKKRNAKVAELVEAKLLDENSGLKKLEYENCNGSLEIQIKDFFDPTDKRLKTLEITFSGGKIKNTSFIILDCCMFSSSGHASIDLSVEGCSDKCDCTELQREYFKDLQEKIGIYKNLKNDDDKIFDEYLDISPIKNITGGNSFIDFGFKRIARIQKQYALFLNKLYYDHRGRIPVNTIRNTVHSYQTTTLSVKVGSENLPDFPQIILHGDGESYYINKSDLNLKNFSSIANLLDLIDDDCIRTTPSNRAYTLTFDTTKNTSELTLKLPIMNGASVSHYALGPTIKQIFKGRAPKETFTINETKTTVDIDKQISIEDLKKGIKSNSHTIQIVEYTIRVTNGIE